MAYNDGKNETVNETVDLGDVAQDGATAGTNEAMGASTHQEDLSEVLGFTGLAGTGLTLSTTNDKMVQDIAKGMREYYAEKDSKNKPAVIVLDKSIYTTLAYSAIITTYIVKNTAYYFTTTLESSGEPSMTAAAMVTEITQPMTQNGYNNFQPEKLFVPGDAIDGVLLEYVKAAIKEEYKNVVKYISVEGLVVPRATEITEEMIRKIATVSKIACISEITLSSGKIPDINISKAKAKDPAAFLKIDSNLAPQTIIDEIGKPVRADFNLTLVADNNNRQESSLNLQKSRDVVSTACGYMDAFPVEVDVTLPGQHPTTGIRLHPQLVINRLAPTINTLGYTLLSFVTTLIMARDNMYLGVLSPKENDKEHDVGAINIITNLENNQNGLGKPLKLNDRKLTQPQVIDLIRKMYSLEPVISLDIEHYGVQTFLTSIFAVAASIPDPTNPTSVKSKQNAGKALVAAINTLTNGIFGRFNPEEIFISEGIVVPTGTWTDAKGQLRDVKDVDLAFIANTSGDVELMNKWVLSNSPSSFSGMDSFRAKVEVINALIPNAEITGKATRVTFTGAFIAALSSAVSASGLDARYEPAVASTVATDLSRMGSYLQGAGIQNGNVNFVNTGATANQYVNTAYGTVGMNRQF